MTPETRLMLIELAEGFAESMRKGTMSFTEDTARRLAALVSETLNPRPKVEGKAVNITQACQMLGISQPTFRKYIRLGMLPQGVKVQGCASPMWEISQIEAFKKKYLSPERKG